MPTAPTVSIIIPAYNASAFIERALASCLAQTYTDYEIIVVDDGSSDGTGDIVRERYADNSVQVIQQENQGVGTARNTGILAAQGDYILALDADDVLHPTYLEKVMQRFREVDDRVAMIYTQHRIIKDGIVSQPNARLVEGDVFCDLLLQKNATMMLPSTATIRKDALVEVGLFPTEEIYSDDWDTWLRLTIHYHVISIDEPLVDRHLHDANVTLANKLSAYRIINVLEKVRDFPKRRMCIDDAAYDVFVADACHKYAMLEWETGDTAITRDYLRRAIDLTQKSRHIRQLYLMLSYVAPFSVVLVISQLLNRR